MQKEVNSIIDNWRFRMKAHFSVIDNLLSFPYNQMMDYIRQQFFRSNF